MNQPISGGTQLSESAGPRERILLAALEVFGELGYNATSTRMLAGRAGVNLAAIPYYFSGKRGLYVAVAEHIAAGMQKAMEPATEAARRSVASGDDDTLRNSLRGVLFALSDVMLNSPQSRLWAPFIMREQANPSEAFEVLHREAMASVMQVTAAVLGLLTGRAPDSQDNLITMHMIMGQILIFRTSRAGIVRALGWDEYNAERLATVQRHVWRNVEAIIDAARTQGEDR